MSRRTLHESRCVRLAGALVAVVGALMVGASTRSADAPQMVLLGLGRVAAVAPVVRAVPRRELSEPAAPPEPPRDDPWLAALVHRAARGLSIGGDVEAHRLQILVTRFDGEQAVRSAFRADAEYFYPASAIKPFLAVAALSHLEQLAIAHPGAIGLDTPVSFCLRGETRCTVARDPTNVDGGVVTVGHEIRKMLLVSSNIAYNRLFDFVGHEVANRTVRAFGFSSVRIQHRMGGGAPGGRASPPYDVLGEAGFRVERRRSRLPLEPLDIAGTRVGRAHYNHAREFVKEPADFRLKNYASLADLHDLLRALVGAPGAEPLPLSEEHRAFVVAAMEENPLRSHNPPYRGGRFSERRHKVSLRGVARVLPRSAFRHVGKAGRAYGFDIDNAFVAHRPSGRAFLLTVAVYVNPNQVINDNGYAYGVSAMFIERLAAALAREIFLNASSRERAPGSAG